MGWQQATAIYSISPFTMLDFPDKVACIVWFAGCNMQCPYCYNPEIVYGKGRLSYADVFTFLNGRKGLLDGVVLSGGECTMHRDLVPFARDLKSMGFALKLDTNGSRPEVLKQLMAEELLDYVALDYKAPARKHGQVTGNSKTLQGFEESLSLLIGSALLFEVRTTYHSALMNEEDLHEMQFFLTDRGYRGKHYLQNILEGAPSLAALPESEKLRTFASQHNIDTLIRN